MSGSDGSVAIISPHSAADRTSFQRMAGRCTSPAASSSTAPCIWPDRPTALTFAHAAGCSARSRDAALTVAAHQACGSCSLQPGWGREMSSRTPADAAIAPRSSSSRSFTSDVPRSMPRYMLTLSLR